MQEMIEMYQDCPVQMHTYEVDGAAYIVTSHFIGSKDINDVIMQYAEERAMREMFGFVPSDEKS